MFPTLISNALKKLLDYFEPILKRAAVTLVKSRPIAFSVALVLLSAGLLEYRGWKRADFYERVVERALSKRTENTVYSDVR